MIGTVDMIKYNNFFPVIMDVLLKENRNVEVAEDKNA